MANDDFWTRMFEKDVQMWIDTAAASGMLVHGPEGEAGPWYVIEKDSASPICNTRTRESAARIAYALAVTFRKK